MSSPAIASVLPALTPALSVVVHDVAPATQAACQRLMRAIDEVALLPRTLLATPRWHCDPPSRAFEQWLVDQYNGGDEIALHGYTHLDDGAPRGVVDRLRRRVYTRGEGEFSDLSLTDAMRRLTAGMRWFRRLGLPLAGFVAPAWLMSGGTWEALRWLPLQYTCTLRRVVLLPERQHLTSQSLVYSTSTRWRRASSVVWAEAVGVLTRRNPVLRLELHPHDADHPAIRRSWQRHLADALAERTPRTLAGVAERLRLATDWDRFDSGLSEEDERELRHQRADRRTREHIARVVHAQHHA